MCTLIKCEMQRSDYVRVQTFIRKQPCMQPETVPSARGCDDNFQSKETDVVVAASSLFLFSWGSRIALCASRTTSRGIIISHIECCNTELFVAMKNVIANNFLPELAI